MSHKIGGVTPKKTEHIQKVESNPVSNVKTFANNALGHVGNFLNGAEAWTSSMNPTSASGNNSASYRS